MVIDRDCPLGISFSVASNKSSDKKTPESLLSRWTQLKLTVEISEQGTPRLRSVCNREQGTVRV
jgi:hypothetical protein